MLFYSIVVLVLACCQVQLIAAEDEHVLSDGYKAILSISAATETVTKLQKRSPICQVCGCSFCPEGFKVGNLEGVITIPSSNQLPPGALTEVPCSLLDFAGFYGLITEEDCNDNLRLLPELRENCGCPDLPTSATQMTKARYVLELDTDKTKKMEKMEKTESPEKTDKLEKIKSEKTENSEKTEKSETTEKSNKNEKSGTKEKDEKSQQPSKSPSRAPSRQPSRTIPVPIQSSSPSRRPSAAPSSKEAREKEEKSGKGEKIGRKEKTEKSGTSEKMENGERNRRQLWKSKESRQSLRVPK